MNVLGCTPDRYNNPPTQIYIIGGSVALFNGFSLVSLAEILFELCNWMLPRAAKLIDKREVASFSGETLAYFASTTVHGLPYIRLFR